MLIGIDLDNTVVCYEQAIVCLIDELFNFPPEVPRSKLGLRDYLRLEGRESEWTAFQGELYGPGMRYAKPYACAIETIRHLSANGHRFVIVSHRSLRPYAGAPHDLHQAARQWAAHWLVAPGLFVDDDIHLLQTRDAKVSTIAQLGCLVFVDDLPEVLEAPGFPSETRGVLFEPEDVTRSYSGQYRISAWKQLPELVAQWA